MKKFNCFLVLTLFAMSQAIAQNNTNQNGVGLHVRGINSGLLNSDGLSADNTNLAIDASYTRNLNSYLNVSVPIGVTMLLEGDEKFAGIHGDILLQGGLFDDTRIAAPYIYAGPSFSLNKDPLDDKLSAFDISGRFGIGVNFSIGEKTLINLHFGYLNNFKDGNKGALEGGVGVIFLFGGGGALNKSSINLKKLNKTDTDGDGIMDIADNCPTVPGVAAFKGCPDTDNDGIADYEDKCPDAPGPLATNGCPDADGDGVPDSIDKCPDIAGDANYGGCPFTDRDQDGVPDDKDLCPDEKGLARYQGCPDTDGDGVPDIKDECPDKVGTVEAMGCPDTDGDGITDKNDKCPTKAGPASNGGCPVTNQGDINTINELSKKVNFEDQQTSLNGTAKSALNELASLLKKNAKYNLVVFGYGDETTPSSDPITLAKSRANAVRDYLISKGISQERISIVSKSMPKLFNRKISFELK
jgi:outer membrane protein OmpA-like peptidoglycan-associated protein